MSHHLISDVHEWINEIPTVPIYYLAKPQPREYAFRWSMVARLKLKGRALPVVVTQSIE